MQKMSHSMEEPIIFQKGGPKRMERKSRRSAPKRLLGFALLLCLGLGFVLLGGYFLQAPKIENPRVAQLAQVKLPSWIDEQIIPKRSDSRRGVYLEDITGIVIHYVGNPGTTAQQNRNYFANPGTEVNSHFLVGLDGEIIQCLPLEEKSSASNERNRDTISIEVCHETEEGAFSDRSYEALLRLTAWLCEVTQLDETAVVRHYDVTGKACPLYYVEHQEAWDQFKLDIKDSMEEKKAP
jgi:N-acetylmuramoyl-L-alanine amidase